MLLLYHMRTCSICGKATTFGRLIRHKHSGIWEKEAPKKSRLYKANLKIRKVDGQRTSVCTKCIKKLAHPRKVRVAKPKETSKTA